jgi:hypothetical protein
MNAKEKGISRDGKKTTTARKREKIKQEYA